MNELTKDVHRWLIECDELNAARFLQNCEIIDEFVDVAFGMTSEEEWIISDLYIYVPLKAFKLDAHEKIAGVVESALREMGHSQGTHYKHIIGAPRHPSNINNGVVRYDAFISHASEDKDTFVRPLAEALTNLGFLVWYDEFSLKVGDSLRQTIDGGLTNSNYGIIVLSTAFFKKNWTNYELDGLTAREIEGKKVILPVWHDINKSDVLKFSPPLANKVALLSEGNDIMSLANRLAEVLIKV